MQPNEIDQLASNLTDKIVSVYNRGGFSNLQEFSRTYCGSNKKILNKYISFLNDLYRNPAYREIQLFDWNVLPIIRGFFLEEIVSQDYHGK